MCCSVWFNIIIKIFIGYFIYFFLNGAVVCAVGIENSDGRLRDLLGDELCDAAVAHDEVVVYLLDLVFGDVHGNDAAHDRDAEALLERADHDKICKVYARVSLSDRSGHDLHADVIIYCAGCNDGVAVFVMREQIKRARDKGNNLIHVKLKIGQLVPCRKAKLRYVLVPAAQLGRNKLSVIYKSFLPFIRYIIALKNSDDKKI